MQRAMFDATLDTDVVIGQAEQFLTDLVENADGNSHCMDVGGIVAGLFDSYGSGDPSFNGAGLN